MLAAISPMRGSDAASVEPALKPNHPNARMSVPTIAIGRLWPGSAPIAPSRRNLPMRGPSTIAPASAVTPPVMCTTDEPGEVDVAVAQREDSRRSARAIRRPTPSCRRAGRGTST